MRLFIFISTFLACPCILLSQNFEGIIIYERQTQNKKVAIEKYYFGVNKLRIDADFINNNIEKYSTIYDFSETKNLFFTSKSCDRYIEKFYEKEYLDSIVYFNVKQTFLDYNCEEIELTFEEGDFGTVQKQRRLIAEDLKFTVPDGWVMEYGMVLSKENRISLFLEEEIISLDIPENPPRGYTRRAIAVIPLALPESIFLIENR